MQSRSHRKSSRGRGISSLQLALLSRSVFDIPPRTRNLIAVAGMAGVVIVVVGSLVGGREDSIPLDKVLHFSGYAVLASLFVLALRPVLYLPALGLLIGGGFLIEYLQSFTGRTMDVADGIANTIGVAVGAALALVIRAAYAHVRRELAVVHARRNMTRYEGGEWILREGTRVHHLYVIKSGKVRLSRSANGKPVEIGVAGPGDVLATLGVLLDTPQFATAEAIEPTTLYRMELADLIDSAGGREQPVCTVLRSLAESLRYIAQRMTDSQAQLDELAIATQTHCDLAIPSDEPLAESADRD